MVSFLSRSCLFFVFVYTFRRPLLLDLARQDENGEYLFKANIEMNMKPTTHEKNRIETNVCVCVFV